MPTYAELEISLHAMTAEASGGQVPYQVELRFNDPNTQAERSPARGECRINFEELLLCQRDRQLYGRTLAGRLFESEPIRSEYRQIKAAVEATDMFLRILLRVGGTAPRLHFLRWELLTDPDTAAPLATSERVLFSRFLASGNWRPIRLRAKQRLKALIAVAAPSNLEDYRLAPIDAAAEVERIRGSAAGIQMTVVGLEEPLTLAALMTALRAGVDLLYLVAHGTLSRLNEPVLFLQDAAGRAAPVPGQEFAARVSELTEAPRMALLISCESGAREDAPAPGDEPMAAQAALAPRLAEAGVPAVLSMQGKISMETVKLAMPVFFRELLRDGQIDRALAVTRRAVLERRDHWMLALFLRLKSGRIWYEAGFAGEGDDSVKWDSICSQVQKGRFVPILGPDLAEGLYGGMREVASRLAVQHGFPMAAADWSDVAKVMQFLSIKQDRSFAQEAIQKQISLQLVTCNHLPPEIAAGPFRSMLDYVVTKSRAEDDDPYRILADLPAPIYVTATPETMLLRSVKAAGKDPELLYCAWRTTETNHPQQPQPKGNASPGTPLIYHVFGVLGVKESLVLTEDDFFDYLIALSTYKLVPDAVRSGLTRGTLLFLGFRLNDWTFRVLFRLIMSLGGLESLREFSHVGVQISPDEHSFTDAARAKKYLEQYFAQARGNRWEPRIDIYWGSAADFLKELNGRLRVMEPLPLRPVRSEGDDDWV